MSARSVSRHRLSASAAVVLMACRPSAPPAPTVGGVVTYRHEVVLPPGARLIITLANVSLPAQPAQILVEDTVAELSAGPIPFELAYDPALIDTAHTYAVAARIMVGESVLFASVRSQEVLTHGSRARVEVQVEPAGTMGPLPERAGDIAARLGSLRRVDGSWQQGEAGSMISAYFDEGALRYLEERMTIGEYGSAANAYYFDEGALFYHETLKRIARDRARSEIRDEVAFRVLFGPDGTVRQSMKWVNGDPAPLEDAELRTALRHAVVLREAALQLAAAGG